MQGDLHFDTNYKRPERRDDYNIQQRKKIKLFPLTVLLLADKNCIKFYPTNTPRILHVETTWKRLFPRLFNLQYMWCAYRVEAQLGPPQISQMKSFAIMFDR